MKDNAKHYRDTAKFLVFAQIFRIFIVFFLSSVVSDLIMMYFQVGAYDRNIDLSSTDPEVLKITLIVSSLAVIITLPFSFCLSRFFLLVSRSTLSSQATVKDFFTPFLTPLYLLKGTALVVVTSLLNALGVFVLVLPVFYTFCMAVFVMSDTPETSVFSALKRSYVLMKGKRWSVFRITIPYLLVSVIASAFSYRLAFVSYMVSTVFESMFFVTLALIYDDLIRDGQGGSQQNQTL